MTFVRPGLPLPPSVSVREVRLAFRGQPLFAGLDLTLEAGQWTCLLGPSGVGKSSLLRLIAGLAPPDASASILCSDGAPLRGRAAYMAQQDLLLPWLTALGNVMLGPRLRRERTHHPATIERARSLLAQVGLAGKERRRPAELSGGERQRVALARTLMEDRPVVLMDEPFSALDAVTRYRLQALAAELLAGRTVLLVTHDPLEALRLGHRIHVMSGRPARLDEPLEPAGLPPRDAREGRLLQLQGELLSRLVAASETEAGAAA
jgi:putative hydroxymethylpyrimidine transport system ATP-binding protein